MFSRNSIQLAVAALAGFLVSAVVIYAIWAKAHPHHDTSDVVAHVGSTIITVDQVRALVASSSPRDQVALARDPTLLRQTIRAVIANKLALAEAIAHKWDQVPDVARRLQQVRDNTILDTYLQHVSTPPDFPSDAEVTKVYEANKAAFLVPRQFRIAQIFVPVAKDADSSTRQKAANKLAGIEAALKTFGADFAELAKTRSEDAPSASRGGEIGWFPENELNPQIKADVQALAIGAISEPIKMDDGWHILKLLDLKEAYPRPLAEVRAALVQQIRIQNAQARRQAYLTKLLEQNPPQIDETALSKIFQNPNPSQ